MPNKNLLNTMILGGDRSGSTWIDALCRQHPDIYVCPVGRREFLSKKEANKRRFFSKLKFNCPMDSYDNEKIILGTRNMKPYHTDKVAEMYHSYNKNIKFILSIRNPISRTVSGYAVRIFSRIQKGDTKKLFDINKELSPDEPHVRATFIYSMLKPYLELFPKENFSLTPIERLNADPSSNMAKIFSFLEVDTEIPLDFEESPTNHRKLDNTHLVPINEDSKRLIVGWCEEELQMLSELTGINLTEFWDLKKYC